jgi:hypothetical protein
MRVNDNYSGVEIISVICEFDVVQDCVLFLIHLTHSSGMLESLLSEVQEN